MWKNEKFSLTENYFREINSLVISFSKDVTFTKFLPKKLEREFPQFPHCEKEFTWMFWAYCCFIDEKGQTAISSYPWQTQLTTWDKVQYVDVILGNHNFQISVRLQKHLYNSLWNSSYNCTWKVLKEKMIFIEIL